MGLQVDPTTALKVFMFFFVGGLAGIADLAIGGQPSFVPLVIILAGFGAVACVEFRALSARRPGTDRCYCDGVRFGDIARRNLACCFEHRICD